MERWKTAGWVPDSDEEDADLAFPDSVQHNSQLVLIPQDTSSDEDELAQPAPRALARSSQRNEKPDKSSSQKDSNVSLLSQTLSQRGSQHGIALADIGTAVGSTTLHPGPENSEREQILKNPKRADVALFSRLDMTPSQQPPDSPSSSLSSASSQWLEEFESRHRGDAQTSLNMVDGLSLAMLADESTNRLPRDLGLSRSFRRRNPIQLHPYILEAERYKRTMHSRGVKALQIQQEREKASQVREDSDSESDNQGFAPSSQVSTAASLEDSQSQQDLNASKTQLGPPDEDLPGVDDLLASSVRKIKRPEKRRKLTHPTKIQKKVHRTDSKDSQVNQRRIRHGLPTPRPSDGVESSGMLTPQVIIPRRSSTNGFRVPPTARSMQFHTPTKSADLSANTPMESFSSPDSPDVIPMVSSRRRRKSIVDDLESSSESGSPSTPTKDRQTASLKRRIRGVLPASWTTVNLQQSPEKRREQKRAQHSVEQQRGVAKPIKTRARQTNTGLISVFSDDEIASSPPLQKLADTEEQAEPDALEVLVDWPDSDNMEDNAFDLMLDSGPLRSRKRKSQHREESTQKLKQSRIPRHFQQKKYAQVKRARRPQRLGVLDNNIQTRDAPNFIRVAARTVKSLPGKGRSSPSRKAFKFHDSVDERDVQTVLEEWKQTGAEQYERSPSGARKALGLVSGNARSKPLPNKKTRGAAKRNSRGKGVRDEAVATQGRRDRTATQMKEALDYAAAKSEVIRSMQSQHRKPGPRAFSSAVVDMASTAPGQLASADLSIQERPSLHFARTVTRPMQIDSSEAESMQPRDSIEWQEKIDTSQPTSHSKRALRKRHPRQLKLPVRREPYVLEYEPVELPTPSSEPDERSATIFKELERYDIHLPLTFGIDSLPTGQQFSARSFIGSGQFADYLGMRKSIDESAPKDKTFNTDLTHTWTSWNDNTRVDISKQVNDIKYYIQSSSSSQVTADECIPRCFLSTLENIARYIAQGLIFTDGIDRVDFLKFAAELLQDLFGSLPLSGSFGLESASRRNHPRLYMPIISRISLLAHQLERLSHHDIVPEETRRKSRQILSAVIKEAVLLVYQSGIPYLRRFFKSREDLAYHDSMDDSAHTQFVEDVAILMSITQCHETMLGSIWGILEAKQVFATGKWTNSPVCTSVDFLERQWSHIFLLLPFFEIDREGCKSINSTKNEQGSWKIVKELIRPLLDAYKLGLTRRLASFNRYCRTVFQRCFHLIDRWDWRRCDTVINFLFDFFAQNGLANLVGEEAHGSPLFLEQLNDGLKLSLSGQDVSFHVLLKIIGSGIRAMRKTVPEKKVKDLVWRLIPNHGRRHPKEQEVRQEDLDATRNHHDLLCTLFWAAPLASRPNLLKVVRNLIEDEGSHRHAYHINIRAWSNLVRYQIKSESTQEKLQPFSSWASDLLEKLLRQHALAKTEVEAQVYRSEVKGGKNIDEATQKRAIEGNQRQVEAVIRDLLISLENAVCLCSSLEVCSILLVPNLKRVFDLYDGRQPRMDRVIISALDVIMAVIEVKTSAQKDLNISSNEDSQGFDWSVFANSDDLELNSSTRGSESILEESIYTALRGLLSSVFNSECSTSDDLYITMVRTWTNTALTYVKQGLKSWENYIGPYGNDTWMVLGDTIQRRKYAPFFFSLLLRGDELVFGQHTLSFLGVWLESLVDREAHMRYQGDLTAQLLQRGRNEPLLSNLPFAANEKGEYAITLDMTMQRRLSLLSTILSNMRLAVSPGACPNRVTRQERLNDYRYLIQQMMTAMKTRYEELGNESETQNSYVNFVHKVLHAMQEHVQDICPLDPFFTSSAAFPLPDSDPTYISSRLRSYGLRLQESRTPKQLAMFLQAVIERAVHDGQQDDLTRHLCDTMSGTLEQIQTPTLRAFFFECVLPAYVKGTAKNSCGWLLLSPLLQVADRALGEMSLDVDGCSSGSIESACSIIQATIECLLAGVRKANSQSLSDGSSIKILAQSLSVINSTFPLVEYFLQLESVHVTQPIINGITEVANLCSKIRPWLDCPEAQALTTLDTTFSDKANRKYHDTQDMIFREVQRSLQRIKMGTDGYMGLRGSTWKNISGKCEASSARQELLQIFDDFDSNVGRLPYLRQLIELGTV